LIRQQLDKLLHTHDATFPKNPLLDDKHVLRLKEGKGKQWKELLQAAPEMLSMKFVKVRGREEYGRQVHIENKKEGSNIHHQKFTH